ncbi:hypothetical protein AQ786_04405 [Burkholderia pseudomallei]|nr:hypothetical protein AQ786_04405 [Burkholderia pseudomallei]
MWMRWMRGNHHTFAEEKKGGKVSDRWAGERDGAHRRADGPQRAEIPAARRSPGSCRLVPARVGASRHAFARGGRRGATAGGGDRVLR